MERINRLDCRELKFDPELSKKRLEKAHLVIKSNMLRKILCFCLYLLGANRNDIGNFLGIPHNTVRSMLRTALRDGVPAFFDRRGRKTDDSAVTPAPASKSKDAVINVNYEDQSIFINNAEISIPPGNKLQFKSIVLALTDNNLISKTEAGSLLGVTSSHVGYLCNKIQEHDINFLIDKRQGQRQDYVYTPELKSEIILQFVVNASMGEKTSGQAIASKILESKRMVLSDRSVRHHISKLGLNMIAEKIKETVCSQKKKLEEVIIKAANDYQNLSPLGLLGANKYFTRLMIRCLLEDGMSTGAVSCYVNRHIQTVARWGARDDIYDLPRSGHPLIYAESDQLKVIGFYCQSQPMPGCGRWSLRMAAASLTANPGNIGFPISKSSIFRILQQHKLKPHRNKYFLHISDPDFFPKMEHIIDLYLNPPRNLFCFDESPGIQVLQRLVPDMRTEETKIRLEEFEYIRNGTTDLFACLEVSTGRVVAECNSRHDTDTLLKFMEQRFIAIPEDEPAHYIMDNLNTHSSYGICALVAKHSEVECPSENDLDIMEKRRQWLATTNKRIVFHFTPFHGSWLNMVEIWFGIIGAKCLKESFSSPEDMRIAIMIFTNELWNRLMAHPFNWRYNGEGLHEKAVERFTCNLKSDDVTQMELRILTKQMILMKNLFCQYRKLISEKSWDNFWTTFRSRIEDFRKVIEQEPGQQRKKRAMTALEDLLKIWTEEVSVNNHVA